MSKRKGTLSAILAEQGFGTRKECHRMIRNGGLELGREGTGGLRWETVVDPEAQIDPNGLHFRIGGLEVPYRERLYLAFHKPAGTECSHSPSHHQSVFSYFPDPFLRRGLEAVGRLDADTTGLLFLSDSGPFNHFLTSPRKHVPKTYRVGTKHPISEEQVSKLSAGVELHGDDGTTLPAIVALRDGKSCDLTIQEGKYHQVKRMFAAVGNRVESIHRVAIGAVALDEGLSEGKWRWLSDAELAALGYQEP